MWVLFLVFPADCLLGGAAAGIVAIGLLVGHHDLRPAGPRPLAAGPRQARRSPPTDSWSNGPWLSMLAHVGLLVGVLVFTYAYLTAAV